MERERTIISFLTQNKHKVIEAMAALAPFKNIIIKQLNEPKPEYKDDEFDDPVKEIAIRAAEYAAAKHNKAVVAEDAGLFFEDYQGFPGMNTKWVMKRLGYKGILKLLEGTSRRAYFRTCLALAEPDKKTQVFEGIIKGQIASRVYGQDVDCMDYDRIFIADGFNVPFALMMENKRSISHRFLAFKALGESLS